MTSDSASVTAGNKPVAYVLVGLPGSGKSTWAAAHPEQLPIASTDEFIENHASRQQISYAEAFRQYNVQAKLLLKERLRALIDQKASFIWDQTNITVRKRRAIYDKLHPTHRVVFVCFCVPIEVCMARAEARERRANEFINRKLIELWSSMTTFPTADEPNDGIIPIIHPSLRQPSANQPP